MILWRDLLVYNSENELCGHLGHLVDEPESWVPNTCVWLDNHGAIETWDQFFIAAEGEEHGWDTPKQPVDWSGFREALESAQDRNNKEMLSNEI